ncbi:hypothetical protein AAT19DRAFT_14737 [Rhodotorula toruloides]|uniref:Uncharacterized protein n=1 Tax=Rhodotorula toruloides TaxID=5286 RepID=A0A2T0A8Q3_RHOTO|nr:hypothetical protein AAT19DRAFT_14737 [Rhodotorula toruloides]
MARLNGAGKEDGDGRIEASVGDGGDGSAEVEKRRGEAAQTDENDAEVEEQARSGQQAVLSSSSPSQTVRPLRRLNLR